MICMCLLIQGNVFAEDTVQPDLIISTSDELSEFRDSVNGGNDYEGKLIILGSDIDLENTSWTTIGQSTSTAFCGTFDGRGYKISGLSKSLFGYLGKPENWGVAGKPATIKNLAVAGKSMSGNGNDAGGVAARLNLGVVEYCYSDCTFGGGSAGVAGVVGFNNNDGIVRKCYNIADVSRNATYVGGVVGQNYGSVEDCYNLGDINTTKSATTYLPVYAGGVVGFNSGGSIANCYSIGNVTGPSATSIGAVVGYSTKSSSNCYYLNNGILTDSNAKALTEDEMKLQSSYAGFDFDTIWAISPDINNGLPYIIQPSFSEPDTNIITQISNPVYNPDTGLLDLNVTFSNSTGSSIVADIFVAAYEDGKMIDIDMFDSVSISDSNTTELSAQVSANQSASLIKVICMTKNMIPVADVCSYEIP